MAKSGEIREGFQHDMCNISFSMSLGAEHVAYVTKDEHMGRVCIVAHCLNAVDFARALSQAFDLRLESYLEESRESVRSTVNSQKPLQNEANPTQVNLVHSTSEQPNKENQQQVEEKDNWQLSTWYHGPIPRNAAERLLQSDGDFLVRSSRVTPHQYVLSAQQNGECHHIRLLDVNGRVRCSSGCVFDTVGHFVRYYTNQPHMPIRIKQSTEVSIYLRRPVSAMEFWV